MKKTILVVLAFLGSQSYSTPCTIEDPIKTIRAVLVPILKADLSGIKLKPGSLKIYQVQDFHNDPAKSFIKDVANLSTFAVTVETVEGYVLSLETRDIFSPTNRRPYPFATGGITLRSGYVRNETGRLGNPESYCVMPLWSELTLINKNFNSVVRVELDYLRLVHNIAVRQ